MNEQNLTPQNRRTKSEQREIAKQGGIASGKSRREKKIIADSILAFLESKSSTTGNKVLDDKVKEAFSNGVTIRDLKVLAEILGELVTKQDITTDGEALKNVEFVFGKPLPKDDDKGNFNSGQID